MDHSVVFRLQRECYLGLGQFLMSIDYVPTPDELIEKDADVRKSTLRMSFLISVYYLLCLFRVVPGCGFLFEAFLHSSCTYTTSRALARMRREMQAANRTIFTPQDVEELRGAEKNSFWFLTFLHLNHMGNTAKRQQFELAYMMDGKGLSDTGRSVLASLDIGVGRGTFAEFKQQYVDKTETENRYFHTFILIIFYRQLLHLTYFFCPVTQM